MRLQYSAVGVVPKRVVSQLSPAASAHEMIGICFPIHLPLLVCQQNVARQLECCSSTLLDVRARFHPPFFVLTFFLIRPIQRVALLLLSECFSFSSPYFLLLLSASPSRHFFLFGSESCRRPCRFFVHFCCTSYVQILFLFFPSIPTGFSRRIPADRGAPSPLHPPSISRALVFLRLIRRLSICFHRLAERNEEVEGGA